MKAPGEDGLDSYAWACLIALRGASDGEEEEGAHANMICWLPINKLATIEPMRSLLLAAIQSSPSSHLPAQAIYVR